MAEKLSPLLKQIAAVAVWLLTCLATPGLCAGELEAEELTRESGERLLKRLESPPAPTPAMKALFDD